MNKQEKNALIGSIALMSLFFGAVVIATTGFGITVPDCITNVKPFKKAELLKLDEKHYELHSIARMWNFDPIEVEIPSGSKLDIYLTSADVAHGFLVEKKAVNMMAIPGQVTFTSISFGPQEVGTYTIVCHEYCGANHHSMQGVIHVRPAADIVPRVEPTAAGGAR